MMNANTVNVLSKEDCDILSLCFPIEKRDKYFWGFTCFSRQEYSESVPLDYADEIMLGVQCVEGGCLCELAVRWLWMNKDAVPQLEAFHESWAILQTPTFTSVLDQLLRKKSSALTPDEFSELLIASGFMDLSDRILGHATEMGREESIHG